MNEQKTRAPWAVCTGVTGIEWDDTHEPSTVLAKAWLEIARFRYG